MSGSHPFRLSVEILRFTFMTVYIPETFTEDEAEVLRPYFSNLDGPVFALVNLPEVVKGALFARYSRSPKSLRRLFLDEFVKDLDVSGDRSIDASVGLDKAEKLYDRVFLEYGDDSVAQLGAVHLACEQASNLLTKILEWGRLMSYLEQSTRYINYDARLGGRYRYFRDPEVLSGPFGTRYVGDMDRMFDAYSGLVVQVTEHVRATTQRSIKDSDVVFHQATRAKGLDAVRGVLPAAALSNVGIFGSGQGYEALLLRMRAHPLPEARHYADLMLTELRKVIPSFLKRVDLPDRGGRWSQYLEKRNEQTALLVDDLFGASEPDQSEEVVLVDFDPDGENKVLAALCYPYSHLPESQLIAKVAALSDEQKSALMASYVGTRENRRHKPGRAFERTGYRFDVLGDYGAFRDLQRHRMLTIDWQRLTPDHGFVTPEIVEQAGCGDDFVEAMERSRDLYEALRPDYPAQAPYAISMAYRLRYAMQFNAREAMHMLELRSAPQGHPSYRRVALEMYRQIAEVAGHRALAAAMTHITHVAPELERLESERRAEERRNKG
jgi:thymidylate synthase ThyX